MILFEIEIASLNMTTDLARAIGQRDLHSICIEDYWARLLTTQVHHLVTAARKPLDQVVGTIYSRPRHD